MTGLATLNESFGALVSDTNDKAVQITALNETITALTGQRTRLQGNVFRPSDFAGPQYVPGVDAAADMHVLQCCFTAAMNTPGGAAALGGYTYLTVENGGTFNTWVRHIAYSFNLTRPLRIEGENATFKMARMPVLYPVPNACFNWFHIGTGYDIAIDPALNFQWTPAQFDALWHWSAGYILRDFNFDSSLLTPANLLTLTGTPAAPNVTGGLLELAGVGVPCAAGAVGDGALIENLHADVAWGSIGIGSNARSNCLKYSGITIDQVYKVGVWIDGPRNCLVDQVVVNAPYPGAVQTQGVGIENNGDCGSPAQNSVLQACSVKGMHTAYALGGDHCTLQDSSAVLPPTTNADHVSPFGINVGATANLHIVFPTTGGDIQRVTITDDPSSSSGYGYAINIAGVSNSFGTAPVEGMQIHDNAIGASGHKLLVGLNYGAWVNHLQYINNDLWTVKPTFDNGSNGHSLNNTFAPNTVH